jgi:hypothetical protein
VSYFATAASSCVIGIVIDIAGGGTYVVNGDAVYVKLTPATEPAPQVWQRPAQKEEATTSQPSSDPSPG